MSKEFIPSEDLKEKIKLFTELEKITRELLHRYKEANSDLFKNLEENLEERNALLVDIRSQLIKEVEDSDFPPGTYVQLGEFEVTVGKTPKFKGTGAFGLLQKLNLVDEAIKLGLLKISIRAKDLKQLLKSKGLEEDFSSCFESEIACNFSESPSPIFLLRILSLDDKRNL